MRGYVSFLLVLLASLALLQLLALHGASGDFSLSDAVAAERAYGLEMNAKEGAIESVRIGAREGFEKYDRATSVENCRHCPDHFCQPPTPADPLPPNACDSRCDACFRESDARRSAEGGALERISALAGHDFGPDFNVSFDSAALETLLRPEPLSKNGYAVDYSRFRKKYWINISSAKFRLERDSAIPGGYAVESTGVD
ncbi:MAG TPA: hypothetical protein VLD37_06415 [Candidatus Bilamarchaeum sp.]|nr:hypothetical protein [Candidatus Bilamarchaeum sp.]